jgi:hypothetical protein
MIGREIGLRRRLRWLRVIEKVRGAGAACGGAIPNYVIARRMADAVSAQSPSKVDVRIVPIPVVRLWVSERRSQDRDPNSQIGGFKLRRAGALPFYALVTAVRGVVSGVVCVRGALPCASRITKAEFVFRRFVWSLQVVRYRSVHSKLRCPN